MSLINDALKRAGQAKPPSAPGEAPPPMRPVTEEKRRAAWPLVVLPLGVLLVFGAGGWFLWRGLQAARNESLNAAKALIAAREKQAERPLPAEPDGQSQPFGATPVSSVAKSNVEAAAEAPQSTFPPVKLQGIYYRPSNPSAVINSKTLFVGETIENVKVLAIDRSSVMLEWNGQTNVLTLH